MTKGILVTGGAGFLGSHLCEQLLKKGHEVICLDNFFTGDKNNIRPFLQNSHFELIRGDVTQPLFLEVEEIYNLACPASPIHYQVNPIHTIKTNVLGAINMLDLAQKTQAKIFQASTSEIYGDPIIHPQTEEYWGNVNPIGVRACYDEGKRCVETLFFDYYRRFQIDIKVARIFNTYGPRMHINDGRVISNFIIKALQNQSIPIYGNGTQTRSFCYVEDLINGIIALMESKEVRGPINLGNCDERSILEIAEMIIKLTKSKSKIEFLPALADDPKQRKPNISLANNKLSWQPRISLEEGLLKTIEYFEKLINKECFDQAEAIYG